MNETPGKTNNPSDDIDLLSLIERCLLFFKTYRWLFITAIVLGILAGSLIYRQLPYVYTSRMIVHPFYLSNQEEIQIIKEWNALLKKKEYTQLSETFHCSTSTIAQLKKIRADEIQKVFSTANPHGFIIEVTVTDNAILDELQAGIVYAFESNEYVGPRLEARRKNLEELVDKTNSEMQKLDVNKQIVQNIIEGKGKSSATLIVDGANVNRQLIEMNEKLLGYKTDLKFIRAVDVLQGFNKFSQPSNPKLIPWLVMGLAFFLIIAYVIALFHSIIKKLKQRAGQDNTSG